LIRKKAEVECIALNFRLLQCSQVPPRGTAHPAKTPGNRGASARQRAKSGAIEPETPSIAPDLAAVVEAWPKLPQAIRAGILAMIRAVE